MLVLTAPFSSSSRNNGWSLRSAYRVTSISCVARSSIDMGSTWARVPHAAACSPFSPPLPDPHPPWQRINPRKLCPSPLTVMPRYIL